MTQKTLVAPMRHTLAASFMVCAMTACGGSSNTKHAAYSAEIRRTAFGVPHIKAHDEAGLGYGIGYAFAEDNFCLLVNEVVTVNGERAKYFGADGLTSSVPELKQNNLVSDYFFRLLNDADIVHTAWQQQTTEVQALIKGYAAGYNRFLEKTGRGKLADECRNAAWIRTITEHDVIKLMRRIAVVNSSAAFMEGLVAAQPPGATPIAQLNATTQSFSL